ncbi:MAG: GntR family transcriptional regulator [Rhizobiaceae bacterium]|nr:GntR family transcriptional regulator [Rhizobiaceae bacterium]
MANRAVADWSSDSGGLEPIARATLQEQVYQQLRNRIMTGFFQPGQPLSTRSVAEAAGVSVMPVRDALRRLEVENALVVGNNRTLQVPILDVDTLQEISAMRIALEGLAVERAMPAINTDDVAVLRNLCGVMNDSILSGDIDKYLEANWAFHNRIYERSSSEIMLSVIESLWLRMGPYFRLTAKDKNHLDNAMKIHHDIVEAMRTGDCAAARSAVVADIEAAAGDLSQWLAQQAS